MRPSDPVGTLTAVDTLSDPTALPAEPVIARAPEPFRLHDRVDRLWAGQALVLAGLVILPGLVVALLSGTPQWAGGATVVGATLGLITWRYGRAYARRFRGVLRTDGLWLARGVFWHRETFVPRARIQHTDVDEGPLARRLGMATLKVFTAGTHASELEIEGLARETAIALRDRLLGRDGADG